MDPRQELDSDQDVAARVIACALETLCVCDHDVVALEVVRRAVEIERVVVRASDAATAAEQIGNYENADRLTSELRKIMSRADRWIKVPVHYPCKFARMLFLTRVANICVAPLWAGLWPALPCKKGQRATHSMMGWIWRAALAIRFVPSPPTIATTPPPPTHEQHLEKSAAPDAEPLGVCKSDGVGSPDKPAAASAVVMRDDAGCAADDGAVIRLNVAFSTTQVNVLNEPLLVFVLRMCEKDTAPRSFVESLLDLPPAYGLDLEVITDAHYGPSGGTTTSHCVSIAHAALCYVGLSGVRGSVVRRILRATPPRALNRADRRSPLLHEWVGRLKAQPFARNLQNVIMLCSEELCPSDGTGIDPRVVDTSRYLTESPRSMCALLDEPLRYADLGMQATANLGMNAVRKALARIESYARFAPVQIALGAHPLIPQLQTIVLAFLLQPPPTCTSTNPRACAPIPPQPAPLSS